MLSLYDTLPSNIFVSFCFFSHIIFLGTCPSGWIYFQGSCYKFLTKTLTWNAAKSACKTMGADLAVITSQAENQFITARLSGAYTFVGLHRDPKDIRRWYWVDGSRPSYLNWDKGEPGNYRGREHCVSLMKSGLWHDTWCKDRIPSICETVGKLIVIKYVVLRRRSNSIP